MSYYLIEIHSNWADEMDIDALKVKSENEYQVWKQGWAKLEGSSVEVCIGTNEEMEVGYSDFDVTKISDEEYKVLEKLGLLSFGHTELIDSYDNDDWDDDNDDWDDED